MDISLYVHIPFCKKKCRYCDFVSLNSSDEFIERYLRALEAETVARSKEYKNAKIKTLYFGGGTPSLLTARQFLKISDAIKNNFDIDLVETTVECNPESVSEEKLIAYKDAGVDRISVGVQSLDNGILRFLGRIHDREAAITAVKLAGKYFDNVSCDLIIGVPGESVFSVLNSVDVLCDEGITHISAYGLKIEEGTVLYDMQTAGIFETDDDFAADVYDAVCDRLRDKGFHRYEISNFAKAGFESAHNKCYWKRTPYLGLGAAAYSFDGLSRFNNTENVTLYAEKLERGILAEENRATLSKEDAMTETVMLSLRTEEGLDVKSFNEKFGCDFMRDKAEALEKNRKFLQIENNNIKLNKEYYYISNSIISDLI